MLGRLVFEDRDDLEGVPGLPRRLARDLAERGDLTRLRLVDRRASALDPFVKYLFRAPDGSLVEAVRIPLERPRWSVCVSSQVGCGRRCAFCETGRMGFRRSLEPWEMVEQVLAVRRDSPERPTTGVVFQGQGEPLDNYDAVMRAAEVLRQPWGCRTGSDRITISTVGLLPAIERFREVGRRYRLILSLGSAFQDRRERLLPVARLWGVEELAEAMRRLALNRGGPVHLAWVMVAGLNTGDDEARELSRLFRGVRVRVSVIDVNDPGGAFRPPGDEERARFLSALAREGIAFVRRYSGGTDIHAACGMLAATATGGREAAGPVTGPEGPGTGA